MKRARQAPGPSRHCRFCRSGAIVPRSRFNSILAAIVHLIASSEFVLQDQLHNSRVKRLRHHSKGRRTDIHIGSHEIRMVEGIVKLRAELQDVLLFYRCSFEKADVPLVEPWCSDGVPSRRAVAARALCDAWSRAYATEIWV